MGFYKNPLLETYNPRWLKSAILKIYMTSFFSAEGGPIWIKFRRLVQTDRSTAVIWSKSKQDVEFQYGGRLGEFSGMSSHSHLPHCSVLPPGEFNVIIPEPRITLQGAASWWIHYLPETNGASITVCRSCQTRTAVAEAGSRGRLYQTPPTGPDRSGQWPACCQQPCRLHRELPAMQFHLSVSSCKQTGTRWSSLITTTFFTKLYMPPGSARIWVSCKQISLR